MAIDCLTGVSAQAEKPQFTPVIAEASDEAANLIDSFQIPEGMKAKLFASEPMLANPVVFCVDHQGRFYVAETFRHSDGVMDNRGHLDWLHDDLASQTVADREKMFRKFLGSQITEFETQTERIRLISDSDGDGVADRSTVFADHFGHLMDGIGAGLLAYRGKVYFACVPKLWLLEDQNNDGTADLEEVLFDGFGVRVAFLGHDLHGLILGPDGRIYFSMGDRGYNLINREGKRLKGLTPEQSFGVNRTEVTWKCLRMDSEIPRNWLLMITEISLRGITIVTVVIWLAGFTWLKGVIPAGGCISST